MRPARGRALAAGTNSPSVRYKVMLANINKKKTSVAFEKAGLVITLPRNTTFVKSAVSPRLATAGAAVFDAQAGTVSWPDAPLAGGQKRVYMVEVKVLPTAPNGPLTFKAACPNCPQLAAQNSVMVRSCVCNRIYIWCGGCIHCIACIV